MILTIRNCTGISLHVRAIEKRSVQLDDQLANAGIGYLSKNFTTLIANLTGGGVSRTPQQVVATATHVVLRQDVDVHVDGHAARSITVESNDEFKEHDTLHLTFDAQGSPHSLLCSASRRILTGENSDGRFTAVFIESDFLLAIHSSTDLNSWMGHLLDSIPISALSIPGTHNSATCYKALPSVRCQVMPIRAQLDNGVRFLDVRVQPEKPDDPEHDGLILVHGVFPVSLTGDKYFRPLVNDVASFLAAHPSETVILSIKREGPGNHTDQQLSQIFAKHYARTNDSRWWTTPNLPDLGEVRGKIVLMRRFALDARLCLEHGGRGYGLDAQCWTHNTPCERRETVCVQDYCDVLEPGLIENKVRYACEQLDRASRESVLGQRQLYLNYLSGSNFWNIACWPDRIAAALNPAVKRHLCVQHGTTQDGGSGGTGVVVCDWVGDGGDWDLIRCIVGQNNRLADRL